MYTHFLNRILNFSNNCVVKKYVKYSRSRAKQADVYLVPDDQSETHPAVHNPSGASILNVLEQTVKRYSLLHCWSVQAIGYQICVDSSPHFLSEEQDLPNKWTTCIDYWLSWKKYAFHATIDALPVTAVDLSLALTRWSRTFAVHIRIPIQAKCRWYAVAWKIYWSEFLGTLTSLESKNETHFSWYLKSWY